jgi:hypothetical protein
MAKKSNLMAATLMTRKRFDSPEFFLVFFFFLSYLTWATAQRSLVKGSSLGDMSILEVSEWYGTLLNPHYQQ